MITTLLNILNSDEFNLNKILPFNTKKDDEFYTLDMILVGYKKSDISVDVSNDLLIIKAKENKDINNPYFLTSDIERKIKLPKDADKENIEASYESGILRVKIGISAESKFTKKVVVN